MGCREGGAGEGEGASATTGRPAGSWLLPNPGAASGREHQDSVTTASVYSGPRHRAPSRPPQPAQAPGRTSAPGQGGWGPGGPMQSQAPACEERRGQETTPAQREPGGARMPSRAQRMGGRGGGSSPGGRPGRADAPHSSGLRLPGGPWPSRRRLDMGRSATDGSHVLRADDRGGALRSSGRRHGGMRRPERDAAGCLHTAGMPQSRENPPMSPTLGSWGR